MNKEELRKLSKKIKTVGLKGSEFTKFCELLRERDKEKYEDRTILHKR